MGVMRRMTARKGTKPGGDEVLCEWDVETNVGVEEAQRQFEEIVKTHLAFVPMKDGDSDMITEFDPNVDEIVFSRMVSGG